MTIRQTEEKTIELTEKQQALLGSSPVRAALRALFKEELEKGSERKRTGSLSAAEKVLFGKLEQLTGQSHYFKAPKKARKSIDYSNKAQRNIGDKTHGDGEDYASGIPRKPTSGKDRY